MTVAKTGFQESTCISVQTLSSFSGRRSLRLLGDSLKQRTTGNGKSYLKKAKVVNIRAETGASASSSVTSEASVTSSEAPVTSTEEPQKRRPRPGEHKGFVEEMRMCAMKLHTKDQSKEGEKESQAKPLAKWEPSKKGYVQYLVDSKEVYDTMEAIVEKASHPMYAEFRSTGLERSARLATDLAWFESEGVEIPSCDKLGSEYAKYLTELSETDPPAFICHFYNVYFAHSAGGRMIGRKMAEMVLDGRELEFYKWDGELPDLLTAVKEKLNQVSTSWTREEKDHCLQETEKSFKYSGGILRLLVS